MSVRIAFISFICLLSWSGSFAQVSYGGMPLLLDRSPLKSGTLLSDSENQFLIDMPAFDLDSVLRIDSINELNMRGSFQFAHKFYTHIERGKDGSEWTLPDGTRVWQVAIRSRGAYSINLLFSEFHVPEGAKLFLYNTDHSYIIGSFDHRNNSPGKLLPVRPVAGETIIVEYSEPADAAFRGQLTIGEINHDYRNILRSEPGADLSPSFDCMPDVVCEEVDEAMVRSTLLVMVNGTVACSGVLLNNTENDGTPYILTAVHCLNDDIGRGDVNYHKDWEYYVSKAGTVVVFFNYNRPICGTDMKATEELSAAIAHPRAIVERKDIALLELNEKPPFYYNAYYAGWNNQMGESPYTNIHHPSSAVKKYNFYDGTLSWMSFLTSLFDANSHLRVDAWTTGSTHAGSSGSPLFDANHAVVGGLSGGWSVCGTPSDKGTHDMFFALSKGWETNDPANQLKTYLDPANTGVSSIDGWDPNREKSILRLSNAPRNNGYYLVATKYSAPNSGFVFGNSNLNITEFAEEFKPEYESELHGAYLLLPPMPAASAKDVEIRVYEGESYPQRLLAQQNLKPQFLEYSATTGQFDLKDKTMNWEGSENFVHFDTPIKITKKFFIAYRIVNEPERQFAVYNTRSTSYNTHTAWINKNGSWMRSNTYDKKPVSTSLAIQAVLSQTDVRLPAEKTTKIRYIRSRNLLLLPNVAPEVAGRATIYTLSGQIIQQLPIAETQQTLTLRPQTGGTIGIARVVRGDEVYTSKFIY